MIVRVLVEYVDPMDNSLPPQMNTLVTGLMLLTKRNYVKW